MRPARRDGPDDVGSELRFGILGALQVLAQGRPVILGPRKQQLVLAVLLGHANRPVSVDALIDALWEDSPPRTARKNLQVYVCALRGLLGATRSHPRITYQAGGYVLEVAPAELDWLQFERRVRDSRPLWPLAEPAVLARALAQALALWRGPVLSGLRGNPVIEAAAQQMESSLLTTFEDWAEAEVAAGGALGSIDRISGIACQHPFRERLRMVQMTALGQIGRRTEALAIYDELRRSLAREFGLTPSPALLAVYEALLRDGAATQLRPQGGPLRRLAALSLLPRDLAAFTGREAGTAELTAAFAGGERLAVLAGPVGVGKTTLAVHVAHQLRARFPDGCYFARLRSADGTPRSPQQVLAQLWWSATESGTASPPEGFPESWQHWLATHRALVVLDDARRESEVRPLLPEAGDSAVIITSWSRLTGLGHAHRATVPAFSLAEALDLLRRIIGRQRVDRDPRAAERIVTAAGRLPLAVRWVGHKLAALSHVPLPEYAGRMDGAAALLDELTAGDVTIRDRLAAAAGDLPGAALAAFPRLGLLAEPHFTLAEAASVLDLDQGAAVRTLETMLETSVITVPDGEVVAHSVVYEMQALAHAYARELALARSPGGTRSDGP
jgi:DNA-binding SARP family transcriptional activator